MFYLIGGGPLEDVHEEHNAEPRDYIRDPVPRLPDHVGFLDEEEYKSLADKHIAANNFDESEAKRYLSKAEALRAELSECEAKARQHTNSLQRGLEVVNQLMQNIMYRQREAQREAAQLLSVKRKRTPEPEVEQPHSKRRMTHLPPLPACDSASRCPASADDDPRDYFAHDVESHPLSGRNHPTRCTRMVSRRLPESSILIYIDGSCLNQNSSTDVQSRKAGCGVVFGTHPPSGQMKSSCSSFNFRLENRGPDGNYHAATSNRGELRAATAALESQLWGTEGWRYVNIATDSTYVVKGITEWVPKWKARQWTKATGEEIANRDLWILLLGLVNKQARKGCEVRFWHIDRRLNTLADEWAKVGANHHEVDRYKEWDLAQLEASYRPRIMQQC